MKEAVEKEIGKDENMPRWITSVSMAHLHPLWEPDDEPTEENDPKHRAYKERRLRARRSPHPTVLIEVRSNPLTITKSKEKKSSQGGENEPGWRVNKIQMSNLDKLEMAFGLPASRASGSEMNKGNASEESIEPKAKSDFGALARQALMTPFEKTREWIAVQDPLFRGDISYFEETDTLHVDAAFEFVLGATARGFATVGKYKNREEERPDKDSTDLVYYLVLPNFLSSSATSLEKFTGWVRKVLHVMPKHDDSKKKSGAVC
mmetsp:Transcript_37904/g.88201  ORF Transcript_37904/g.88201 Transcript_37904/m.88201 type:complete len:262 (-) Transcript_37904:419-1204(-)